MSGWVGVGREGVCIDGLTDTLYKIVYQNWKGG